MKFYRLDGKVPVPCGLDEWIRLLEGGERQVALDKVNQIEISTVFLGLDHSFGHGKPLLFETMVFGGEDNGWCRRYSTWEEAEHGHAITVAAEMIRRLSTPDAPPDAAPGAPHNR